MIISTSFLIFLSCYLNLFLPVTAQTITDLCDSYNHPQYGYGQCVNHTLCPNALFQNGLCQTKPSYVQCCFSLVKIREEFRAIWIATVNNMDWPGSKTATPSTQQTELINILNTVQRLNMNTVIFQVRKSNSFK